jgi:hypothetical protein
VTSDAQEQLAFLVVGGQLCNKFTFASKLFKSSQFKLQINHDVPPRKKVRTGTRKETISLIALTFNRNIDAGASKLLAVAGVPGSNFCQVGRVHLSEGTLSVLSAAIL